VYAVNSDDHVLFFLRALCEYFNWPGQAGPDRAASMRSAGTDNSLRGWALPLRVLVYTRQVNY